MTTADTEVVLELTFVVDGQRRRVRFHGRADRDRYLRTVHDRHEGGWRPVGTEWVTDLAVEGAPDSHLVQDGDDNAPDDPDGPAVATTGGRA